MTSNQSDIDKIRFALNEVLSQRDVFTSGTYTQIVLALYDKLRRLQTASANKSILAANPDEIRLVSVMFIDIKDSTRIAQQLETEDFKTMLADVHRRIAEIVQEWGGEVGQYLGDGLLCFFGAHRSRTDDASRAVSAALTVQKSMETYAQQFEQRYAINFAVRTAISTGRVVVGMIGTAEKKEFLAMGTTTNLAARLQNLANPTEILIDAETYRRIQSNFVVEARPPVQLKGFEDPVTYYVVTGQRRLADTEGRKYQIAGIDLPFLGRKAELAQIAQAASDVEASKQLRVITISGEMGTGKTRLLHHLLESGFITFACVDMSLRNQAQMSPYTILHTLITTYCHINDDMPLDVIEDTITDYFRDIWPTPDGEAVAAGIGHLAGYGFDDSPHLALLKQKHSGQDQIVARWLVTWLQYLYPEQPLLVLIDNLHWVDSVSLQVLRHLFDELRNTPTLVVTSLRTEAAQSQQYFMIDDDRQLQIELDELDRSTAHQLVQTVLQHVQNTPPTLETLIVERTGANPLFIQEFLRMLFDGGVFQRDDTGQWVLNAFHYNTVASTLPNSLLGILQARLDDLPDPVRQALQFAAVVGDTFWHGVISALTGYDTLPLLDDLESRSIIARNNESTFDGQIEYVFTHSLYREVAYEMMTRATRERYHQRVVRWLAARVGERSDYLELLARHYVLGGLGEEALSTYLKAAEERMGRGLIDESLRLIEAGLASARNVSREHALPIVSQLWLLQAQAYDALQLYAQASAACETAIMLMGELPPETLLDKRILAARVLGDAYRGMGQYDKALGALQEAESLLTDDDIEHQSSIARAFSLLYFSKGDLNASLHYQQIALEQAEQTHNLRQIAGSLASSGLIAHERGNYAMALRAYNRALEINRRLGNIYYQIMDLLHLGTIYRAVSAYEEALSLFEEADTLQHNLHFQNSLHQVHRALCMLELGDLQTGKAILEAAMQTPPQNAHTQQIMRLAYINGLLLIGDYERCLDEANVLKQEVEGHNLLLFGRVLFWIGAAQYALRDSNAAATAQTALEYELIYGGRNAWRCYHLLGRATADPDARLQYYQQACEIVQTTAATLHDWPELRTALLSDSLVTEMESAIRDATQMNQSSNN
ncbi:MAG: hypothetical protein D6737_20710 [Chloroflexi bacterium]|nr:MAG: hypothetical protein D6737_20710 [Chloroflexota bacterium]